MKVFLYNLYHNGDLLFNQPIIRNLCSNNPDHSFTMFCQYNSYMFKEIPNITVSHDLNLFVNRPTFELYFMVDNDTIAINMWIGSLATHSSITQMNIDQVDCNIPNYVVAFKRVIENIQETHPILLTMDDYKEECYEPIIPTADIPLFWEWNQTRSPLSKLIFYYNFLPKSGQYVPVLDHDELVLELSKAFPQYIFLIPTISNELEIEIQGQGITNIMDCSKSFDCHENITCDNLAKLEMIVEECDYSIHFDIGACFYYINKKSSQSKNTILHVSKGSRYYDSIYSSFSYLQHKMRHVQANHAADVYLKLQDIL